MSRGVKALPTLSTSLNYSTGPDARKRFDAGRGHRGRLPVLYWGERAGSAGFARRSHVNKLLVTRCGAARTPLLWWEKQ